MFGGCDDSTEFNDLWVFDTTKNVWREIESVNGPSSRYGSKMVFDPVGNQLFITGRHNKGDQNLKVSSIWRSDEKL